VRCRHNDPFKERGKGGNHSCVAVCSFVLQKYIRAVYCSSVLQCVVDTTILLRSGGKVANYSCIAVYSIVLQQYVAAVCFSSVLQCVADTMILLRSGEIS